MRFSNVKYFCLALLIAITASPSYGQGDVASVEVAVRSWERMWNTFDLREVDRLFLQDETLTYFSSEREGLIRGIESVRKHYQSFGFVDGGTFPLTKLWLDDVRIYNYESTALVTGLWFFQREDGRLQKGPVTINFVRQDGDFRIAHMNFSNYPAEELPENFQAVSLLGTFLTSSSPSETSVENLRVAKQAFALDGGSAESTVWLGRRTAYTGDYREAIRIYTVGIEKFPNEPRLYRHRGHRLISIREFDAAIRDLERALELVEGTKDVIEQDGLPNPMNTPISTLQGNIRYHLGLAYYLAGRLEEAATIYRSDVAAGGRDEVLVATTHWLYMTLRQLGLETEANRALEPITADMELIENQYYRDICLFYKGTLSVDEFLSKDPNNMMTAASHYGVANWYSCNGDEERANELFREIIDSNSWASFGYIAAEADLARQQH